MSIELKNIGPVKDFAIELNPKFGVTVLRAPNGSGKSIALDSVQKAISGKGKVPLRDGQRRGTVDAFGARLTVGASTRRSGEAEVTSLEGRFDLSALVSPGLVSPEAADRKRIKSLVGLSGIKADAKLFSDRSEFAPSFKQVVNPSSMSTDDLVEMAAAIRRDYQEAARQAEDKAVRLKAEAVAHAKTAEDVDMDVETDADELTRQYDAARDKFARLTERRETYQKIRAAADDAAEALERITADRPTPPTTEELADGVLLAESTLTDARHALDDAMQMVERCKAELATAETQLADAKRRKKEAEWHRSEIESYQRQIDTLSGVADVDDDELLQAEVAVQKARQAIDRGGMARRAKESLQSASDAKSKAMMWDGIGVGLRNAATATDDVLSDAIQCEQLRVEAIQGVARLVVDTPRGVTPYGELSDGERWRIAIDLGAERVGEGGLLVITQEAWEALDQTNREEVHRHATERKVHILTAAASGSRRGEQMAVEHYTAS